MLNVWQVFKRHFELLLLVLVDSEHFDQVLTLITRLKLNFER